MASLSSDCLSPDDVVISGIGGTFPQSDNMDEFERNLFDNILMVQERNDKIWARDKIDVPRTVGTMRNKDKFDASCFGVSYSQANEMDPMTWKLLENTYEALIDSGINPSEMRSTNTAVIMATNLSEYSEMTYESCESTTGYSLLGCSLCMLANRVSFWLNTTGTCFSFYSEESAGIRGIEMAEELLRTGQSDAVIVGTVNFVSNPEISFAFKGLRFLNNSGECKAFDANGSGFARSEACIVLYLQRAEFAKRVYATVVGSQSTCNGDTHAGVVRPSGDKLSELLENFYEKCGVDTSRISYLESSASGIKEYEQAEFAAVDKILLRHRKQPLLIGSVKSNMGHASAAATFCSIAKVLIAMEREVIPANLHYETCGSHIPGLSEGRLEVVTKNTKWTPGLVALNNLDFSGNYSHVLLRPHVKSTVNSELDDKLPRLICMSGRNEEATKINLNKVKNMERNVEFIRLIHDVHSLPLNSHNYRGFTITPSVNELVSVQHFDGSKRPVWFVFSGMGSQWTGMGRCLMQLPVIAQTIEECHRILQPKGVDLINILTTEDPHIFDNILHSFVGIAAVQISLVDTLKLLNISPDGLIGHSVGELGCAYADGCFTKEQTILAAYYRGLASLEAQLIPGSMAAVGIGYNAMKHLIPQSLDVACHNSESSCTISGPAEDIRQFVTKLQGEYIFAREVNSCNIAYHSRYIKPAAPKLLNYLKKIIPSPVARSSRWYCTSSPQDTWGSDAVRYSSPEYHTNNLLNPVLFEETSKHIPKNAILIEIAPHGLLQAILKKSIGENVTNVPLAQRGYDNGLEFLLAAIGKLYLAGVDSRISAIYQSVSFPVSRGTPSLSSFATWDYSETYEGLQDTKPDAKTATTRNIRINLKDKEFSVLKDYEINGNCILPTSAVLVLAWKELANILSRNFFKMPVVFEELVLFYVLKFEENDPLELTFILQQATKNFEIIECGKDKLFARGKVTVVNDVASVFSNTVAFDVTDGEDLESKDIYNELESKGHEYGEQFRRVTKATLGNKGCKALVRWSNNWITSLESLLQLKTLCSTQDRNCLELPMSIRRVFIDPLNEGADLHGNTRVAVYNRFTDTLCCGSLELRGIEVKKVCLESTHAVTVTKMEFCPYKRLHYKSCEEFINYAIQLSMENSSTTSRISTTLTLLGSNETNKTFEKKVKECVKRTRNIKVVTRTLSHLDSKSISNNTVAGSLLLANDYTVNHGILLLRNFGGLLLARMSESADLELQDDVAVIDKQCFEDAAYILLKKCIILNGNSNVVFLPSLELLEPAEIVCEEKSSRQFLVAENVTLDDISTFITQVCGVKNCNLRSFRFVFIVDRDAPPFDTNKQFYLEQLKLDFAINIYYNGSWGSLRHAEMTNMLPADYSTLGSFMSVLRVKEVHWKYLGINLRNVKTTGKVNSTSLSALDVSGTNAVGQRVMCLAHMDTGCLQATTEPHFTWPVPDAWSLEDAATVPFAYSLAYYSLVLKAAARAGESVLIQAGHTYIGQAFIAVALENKLQVFTTVCNEEHIHHLRAEFPQIPESRIYYLNDRHVEGKLLRRTLNKGFRIVVNSLEQPVFQMSVSLVSLFGRLLQLCTTEMEFNKEFGMQPFLKNLALIAIIPEQMLKMNVVWKQRLHELLTEGIISGAVKPMLRKVFVSENEEDIVSTIQNVDCIGKAVVTHDANFRQNITDGNKQLQKETEQTVFYFDCKSSCLIIGDEAENCMSMAEWLVTRGCYFLQLCCKYFTVSPLIRRWLSLLQSRHNVVIDIVPMEHLCSFLNTDILITNMNNIAPLYAVFVIAMKNDLPVKHIQSALCGTPMNQPIVLTLNCDVLTVSSMRSAGLRVRNVNMESQVKGNNLRPLLNSLDKLLLSNTTNTTHISIREKHVHRESSSREHLSALLPTTVEQLEKLGEDMMSVTRCSLEEVCSKSPGLLYVREVHPVYIIAGLQDTAKSSAEALACNLMCPAVVVKIPGATERLQENVPDILKEIRLIQPEGPYNLVGISWGGMYAIKLARQLQAEGENTQVFLIDGAPETNQDIARHLGVGDQLQVNLLMRLLNITSKEVQKRLLELPSWDSRLDRALAELPNNSSANKIHVAYAIDSLYSKMNTLISYKSEGALLSGKVTLFRSNVTATDDTCELDKIFKEAVNVVLIEGDHKSILESPRVADTISDLALVNIYWKSDRW